MTAILERTALEARREELHGHLATALQLERDAKFKAGMDDSFIPEMNDRSDQVRRIQQQLEGLETGFEQISEQEMVKREAEQAEHRREAAVALHSVMARRMWALGKIQTAYSDMFNAIKEARTLTDEMRQRARHGFAFGGTATDNDFTLFLMNTGAVAQTDLVLRASASIEGFRFDMSGLALTEERALSAMAKALPEVLDADVREAGGEDALKQWNAVDAASHETPGQ